MKVKTKLNKGAEPVETELVILWDEVPEDKIRELATRSVVIQWQSNQRIIGSIPKTDEVRVADLITKKVRAKKVQTPADIVALAKANPELLAQLKELLGGK
jgi:hypothetical protein